MENLFSFVVKPEKAVNVINGGVAAATNNHIDSILDSSSANLVVASAIYVADPPG